MKALVAASLIVASCLIGCAQPETSAPADHAQSVWAVDFIRLLPGGAEDYLKNIRGNWAQARDIALRNGDILSFNALRAADDSSLGWDIMLMTEYTDSTTWTNREEIFAQIFDSAEYERVQIDRPSSELREFVNGAVVLHPIVTNGARKK